MDTTPAPKARYPHLDVLRVTAMYLVILLHCLVPYITNAAYYGTRSWWCLLPLNALVRAGVPLYFMISGFLALNSPISSPWAFYRKKLGRLLPPFLFWDVVYFLLNCRWSAVTPSVTLFLRELVVQGSKYHLWFVYQILAFYLLTPFLKKLADHCSEGELWGLLLLMLLPTAILPMVNTLFPVYIAPFGPLFDGYLGYYFLGYVLGRQTLPKKHRLLFYLGALAGLALSIWINHHASSPEGVDLPANLGYMLNHYLIAAGLFVWVQQWTSAPGKIRQSLCRLAQHLSRYAYGVYLVHVLVLELYQRHAPQWNLAPVPELLVTFALVAAAATALCALLSLVPVGRRLVT